MSLRFIETAPAEGACRLKCTQIVNRRAQLLYCANIPLAAPSHALDVEGDPVGTQGILPHFVSIKHRETTWWRRRIVIETLVSQRLKAHLYFAQCTPNVLHWIFHPDAHSGYSLPCQSLEWSCQFFQSDIIFFYNLFSFFFAVWLRLTSFVFLRKDKLYKNYCFQRESLRLSSLKNLWRGKKKSHHWVHMLQYFDTFMSLRWCSGVNLTCKQTITHWHTETWAWIRACTRRNSTTTTTTTVGGTPEHMYNILGVQKRPETETEWLL